jgi:hypothetical protein
VQQRAELDAAALMGRQPELLGYAQRQLDDFARVVAGVGVVGLDDVAEQRCRPAVGA